ncbi:MAG: YrdB family protein [Steroidobacteraceae bacterium]
MRFLNLLLRFLLELSALAALVFAGSRAAPHSAAVLLAITAPCCFAILWGLFAAHRARGRLPRGAKAIVGVLLLEASAMAVAIVGRPALAGTFAVLILANSGLLHVWRQDEAEVAEPTT